MKRRDVLRRGVAAGIGMVLLSPREAAGAENPSEEIRVALIGAGMQGRALINAALLQENVRFRAVCDIWDYSRRFASYYLGNYGHEVTTYADYREMLAKEKDLDAVLVASPDFVHADQTNACLKAGLHVYCESMMSSTVEGARSMVRTMRSTGKLLQIGYQRRSNPRYLHARDRLFREARITGRTTQLNAQWVLPLRDDRGWPKRHTLPDDVLHRHGYGSMHELRNWRWYRKYSGGLFGNLGGYQIDIASWFLGVNARSVLATGSAGGDEDGRWPRNVMAICDYETSGGPVQAFHQLLTTTRGDGSVAHEHFLGTEGSVKISENPRWTAVHRDPDAPDWERWVRLNYVAKRAPGHSPRPRGGAVEASETGEVEKYELPVVLDRPVPQPHLENFFKAIAGKASLSCPADAAFRSEVVALRTSEALAARKLIRFTPEDFVV